MPKLSSGRHLGIVPTNFVEAVTQGSDEQRSIAIMAFRLEVSTPQKLKPLFQIAYFREGEGEPPNAPRYLSGFTVGNILEGKSDWTDSEAREFAMWVESDARFIAWTQDHFDEINAAIKQNSVWQSPLWTDD